MTIECAADDIMAAVRALARAEAPRLIGCVPRKLYLLYDASGVECGGPGLALRLFEEQLVRGAVVARST